MFILGLNLSDYFILLLVLCLHIYLYFLYSLFLEDFKFKFDLFLCINHISHLRFFITSIFSLTIFIIIFSSVSLSIDIVFDIVFINQFDVTRLGDYNKILSNFSKEEVTELTCDILNNESLFFDNPSNYFFAKLNNIPVPHNPLGFYDYPNTNGFVSNFPGVRFADPQIAEFCRLYPDEANFIREHILYDFLLYNSESDFFSVSSYPTLNVYHLVKLKGMTMNNLSYFSQLQLHAKFQFTRNYQKNVFLSYFSDWKIYGRI